MTALHCNVVITQQQQECALLISPYLRLQKYVVWWLTFRVPSDTPLPNIIKIHKNQFNKGWLNKSHIFNYSPMALAIVNRCSGRQVQS